MNISEKIRKLYNEYVEQNGYAPEYAVICGEWRDDGVEFNDIIKIRDYENEWDNNRS